MVLGVLLNAVDPSTSRVGQNLGALVPARYHPDRFGKTYREPWAALTGAWTPSAGQSTPHRHLVPYLSFQAWVLPCQLRPLLTSM